MEIEQAIRDRKSIRAYLPDAVPPDVIWAVLELAIRAPSASNCQPWELAVVTGATLTALKDEFERLFRAGQPRGADYQFQPLTGVWLERQRANVGGLTEVLGPEVRADWLRQMLRFFEAPAVIILYTDAQLDPARSQFDLGSLSQTIALAALKHGLGTCLSLAGVGYPDAVREIVGIDKSKKIALAITLGYAVPGAPVNEYESPRAPLAELVLWRD
jgi:nitroreductase